VAYSELKPFENHMNSEHWKTVWLVSKYQSLPSRSAEGFSERPVIGWDSLGSSALPRKSLQVARRLSHFPQRDLVSEETAVVWTGHNVLNGTQQLG
jgi:hypothetical protein